MPKLSNLIIALGYEWCGSGFIKPIPRQNSFFTKEENLIKIC